LFELTSSQKIIHKQPVLGNHQIRDGLSFSCLSQHSN